MIGKGGVVLSCLFCRIVNGEIPSQVVYSDDLVYAFKDIDPKAPVHILLIPKTHYESLSSMPDDSAHLLGHMQLVISKIAKDYGLDQSGYRVVTNIGEQGGQSVGHLHYHILGGRMLTWPPG